MRASGAMKSSSKKTKAAPKLAPIADRLLESRAVQFIASNQTPMVLITWLALRFWQMLFLIPNQDVKRYFDTSGQALAGLIPYAQFQLEYPPGALVLFSLPRYLTDDFMRYGGLFAAMMFVVDAAILYYLWRIPQRIAAKQPQGDVTRRYDSTICMLAYIGLTAMLGALAFERYDLVVALLFLAWIDQCLSRTNLWVADLLIALGIWVKLISALLVPLYLVFLYTSERTEPAKDLNEHTRHFGKWLVRHGSIHVASILGFTLGLFMPFYMMAGDKMLFFIQYHVQRGAQLESLYSSILLFLHDWGGLDSLRTQYVFGCTEVVLPEVVPFLAKASSFISLAVVIALSCVFAVRLTRAPEQKDRNHLLVEGVMAVLLAFILFNKVFSPQYLLWMAPFVPLVMLREQENRRSWAVGYTVTFFLTALILLFYYVNLIYMDAMPVIMLLTRNGLLAALLWNLLEVPAPEWGKRFLDETAAVLKHPAWGYVVLAMVVTWAFVANLSETTANDIWIQIRSGADIMKSGSFPDKEVYSATVLGVDFIAHEWLSSVIFYELVQWFGGAGLSFLAAGVAVASLVLLYFSQEKEKRQTLHYVGLVILCTYLVSFRVLVRPHIFTIVAQSAMLLALERWRRSGKITDLVWLIPIQFIWVNMHAAALFGPGLLFALCGVVGVMVFVPGLQRGSEVRTFTKQDIVQLGGMAVALSLACLVNPYGTRLLTFSLDLMNNDYAKSRVWEWTTPFMPANLNYYWLWLYTGTLVLLWLSILVRIRTLPVIDFALAAIVTFMSVRANRFVPDLAIFAFPVIARSLYWLETVSLKDALRIRRPWVEMGVVALLLTQAVTYGYAHSAREHRPMVGWGFGGDMPYQEVDIIKKMGLRGTIFNEYSDGALIIHTLVPEVRPVLDSRIDLYPISLVTEYDNAYVNPNLFRQYVNEHRVNIVLLYRGRAHPAVLNYLAHDPQWRLLSTTNGRVLYYRTSIEGGNNAARAIPRLPVPGSAAFQSRP